ncbi:type I polyketide synthase [Stigmatella erecta]|uniref:Phosphopantetheine attachment site n=1 Tax=Stigmatella erecta TaxID=83460 RepID=A0A1I0K5I5_9BACT|nr:type I polyketide synthase [Stigmatella erecta]SEU18785.1 Phosphopantetheine attachment site [Stigmatella erecta]
MRDEVRGAMVRLLSGLNAEERSSLLALLQSEQPENDPVAVVGMGGRFPGGAHSPEAFWRLLQEGRSGITEIPKSRWDIDALFHPDPDARGKMYGRWGGFLEGADQFDPQPFGISDEEAARMDPQQRLLLEVCWEALESAGESPTGLAGSRTGVFVGLADQGYNRVREPGHLDDFSVTDHLTSVASGRLSHVFGFHGPSVSIEAACASSLVALHLAAGSLRRGESDLAIAGGVTLLLQPEISFHFCKLELMSRDGRVKAFDAKADGAVRSEGCALLVLKRYSQALADGNPVLALLRGGASTSTGRGVSLSAPSVPAMRRVMSDALASAGLTPADVDYVETHGSGTWAGDAIELQALRDVFGAPRPDGTKCVLGAVKTNLGQMEYAGGAAGVIKAILAFQNEAIPPNLNYSTPHPRVRLTDTPLVIPTQTQPWPRGARRRIAGVTGFGLSGALAHVLLEEPPLQSGADVTARRPVHVLTLSASSAEALAAQVERVAPLLDAIPEQSLGDFCFTANAGRAHFSHRLAVTGQTPAQLRDRLRSWRGEAPAERREPQRVGFLFHEEFLPQGAPGQELYATQPVFRDAFDRCTAAFAASGAQREVPAAEQTQFSLGFALAELWKAWGVRPAVVLGKGAGEVTAACVAGAMDLETAVRTLVARPSREDGAGYPLIEALPPFRWTDLAQTLEGQKVTFLIGMAQGEPGHFGLPGFLPSFRAGRGDWEALAECVARLYERGVEIDWRSFDRPYGRRAVAFPGYTWQRRRFWLHRPTDGSEPVELPRADDTAARVRAVPAQERRALLQAHLTAHLAKALRVAAGELSMNKPLILLGLDSLMTVELRRKLKSEFGFNLAVARLLAGACIADLAQDIEHHLAASSALAEGPPPVHGPGTEEREVIEL